MNNTKLIPTSLRKSWYFWLWMLTILGWPILGFISPFIFDAPIRTPLDEFCRSAIFYLFIGYPLWLVMFFVLGRFLSVKLENPLPFLMSPFIIPLLVVLFYNLDMSDWAKVKPEHYDASTFKRLNDNYALDHTTVYYQNTPLPGANPATFRLLDDNYVADDKHVYFCHKLVEGADPATFESPTQLASNEMSLFNMGLAKDANDYYYYEHPLHVADMATFKRIGQWCIDSQYVYYLKEFGQKPSSRRMRTGDLATFRKLGGNYACDAKYVYYEDTLVAGADPATFQVLQGCIGQDKSWVYYAERATTIYDLSCLQHKKVGNTGNDDFYTDGQVVYNPELYAMPLVADFATIRRVEPYRDWYADTMHVYYENKLLEGVNPQSFNIFPDYYVSSDYVSNNNKSASYSQDGHHVYYKDSLIADADVATFVCGYDFEELYRFAFDKTHFIEGHTNPRIEQLRLGKLQVDR